MKNITFNKKDAYDFAAVMATIVREKSDVLDFKEIINCHEIKF